MSAEPLALVQPGIAPVKRRGDRLGQLVYRLTLPVIAIIAVCCYAGTHLQAPSAQRVPVVWSDGSGYYSYLPAYLIEHDPTFRTWVATERWHQPNAGIHFVPATGHYLQQFPVGEAMMTLPFFGAGHIVAKLVGARADGYSPIETGAAGLAGVTYMLLGLWILGRSLRRYFTPLVTAAVLITITFGTALFNYGTFESIFSHAFSFFLLAVLIELLHRWLARPREWKLVLGLGVVIGLIVLVRQANILFLLLLPTYGVASWSGLRTRMRFFLAQRGRMMAMFAVAAITFAPQSLIWHEATGHWLINSYPASAGTFDFSSPNFLRALFSFYPHGVFPWAPILLLAVIGLVPMWRLARPMFLPTVTILPLLTFVIGSWTYWYYGGGYGHRGFVDALPILAFALGSLYAATMTSWPRRFVIGPIAFICCALVMIQMVNYWSGLLPPDGVTFHTYLTLLRGSL